jgi:shikimate kinase
VGDGDRRFIREDAAGADAGPKKAITDYTTAFSDLIAAVRNIILVGMMGSGKSTVGRRLAGQLGRPFIDADTVLEERCGVPISTIFELEGEVGFRFVVYLQAGVAELWHRLRRDRARPLLRTSDPRGRIEALVNLRDPLYREASHLVVTTGRQLVERTVADIVAALPADLRPDPMVGCGASAAPPNPS